MWASFCIAGRGSCFACLLSLAIVFLPTPVRAGDVDAAGQALRTPRAAGTPTQRGSSGADNERGGRNRDDDDDDDDLWALRLLALPWTIPPWVIHTAHPVFDGFPDYPYASHRAHGSNDDGTAAPLRPYAFRVGVGGTLRSASVVSGVLHAQLDFRPPLAIRAQYRVLAEAASNGDPARWAGLGDVEILWRFAQSTPVNFYTGLGYTHWADRLGILHGMAFIYGFESYPSKPFTFGSRISAGPVGSSYVLQWRTYLGVMLGRVEFQAALDHVDVAGVSLGGAMLSAHAHL